MNSKRGAMELSMSTIVIVVLSMALLVGGLLLVRNITGGANELVDLTNRNVLAELNSAFTKDNKVNIINLGSSKIAEIEADNKPYIVQFGGSTIDGDGDSSEMKYSLKLDSSGNQNCLIVLGEEKMKSLLDKDLETEFGFIEGTSEGNAFAQIEIKIPEGTKLCSQVVQIVVYDGTDFVGMRSFTMIIKKKGLL
jgi:hypothetical protein